MELKQPNQEFETRKQIDEKILKSYKYGSRVYGCHTEKSDYDYIVIVESDKDLYYSVELIGINYTVYSESLFIKKIQDHRIDILECIFQDETDPYLQYFKLDKAKLRRAISSVASNSYGKCKKKLAQGDDYIGKKSMFHSIRIYNFGIQIAQYGKITNYASANIYLKMVMELKTWDAIHAKFKPIFNSHKSIFKKKAPLEDEVA